jgi:predicted DNA-binding antitoxin AbrB/MazE fold protein
MVIHAVYENGVFRPNEPVSLPENCQVELVLREMSAVNSPAVAGTPLASLAAIAGSHSENPAMPTDLASQHDHYLYGTPKR